MTIHKRKSEIKLGKSEVFTEDIYPESGRCPKCNGILVTNYGDGISCTFCVDCDYNEYLILIEMKKLHDKNTAKN